VSCCIILPAIFHKRVVRTVTPAFKVASTGYFYSKD